MKQLVEDNLYAFYDEVGSVLKTGFFKDSTISWMNTGSSSWPNMIYNTSFSEEKSDEFVHANTTAIKDRKAPPFWLLEDGVLNETLSQKLSKAGMRPIMHWTGMGISINAPLKYELSPTTKIRKVENTADLNAWQNILNQALMTSNKIQDGIFEKLYKQDNFKLYLVLENDVPVATGLAYFNANNCGIYMISTLAEHRQKGYGSAVTKHCINAAHQKGITNIVLQASDKGVSIYEKMGFKEYCEFNIMWMLGKDFK